MIGPRRRPVHPSQLRRGERGQVTVFFVVLLPALLACAGLVLDGGLMLRARVTVIDQAQEAARAGAQQIDLATYRRTGTLTIDRAAAVAAAQVYLAATTGGPTRVRAEVTVTGDLVTVTVTGRRRTQLLTLVGVRSLTVHGSATATASSGIDQPHP